MWDLATIKRQNREQYEKHLREWRGKRHIRGMQDIENLHPFPKEKNRKVILACPIDQGDLVPCLDEHITEANLKTNLKEILVRVRSFTLSLIFQTPNEVGVLIWFD